MRAVLAGIALSLLVPGTVAAEADPMTPFYGNTLEFDGEETAEIWLIYIDADGSFAIPMPDGTTMRGEWTREADEVCFTAKSRACFTDLLGRAVGEPWTGVGGDDAQYSAVIRPGRPAEINAEGTE